MLYPLSSFVHCAPLFYSYRGVTFYVSGASVPGEGELKCIDWIKHMCQEGTEESAVIVGGDADLVLQGLALPQVGTKRRREQAAWVGRC